MRVLRLIFSTVYVQRVFSFYPIRRFLCTCNEYRIDLNGRYVGCIPLFLTFLLWSNSYSFISSNWFSKSHIAQTNFPAKLLSGSVQEMYRRHLNVSTKTYKIFIHNQAQMMYKNTLTLHFVYCLVSPISSHEDCHPLRRIAIIVSFPTGCGRIRNCSEWKCSWCCVFQTWLRQRSPLLSRRRLLQPRRQHGRSRLSR